MTSLSNTIQIILNQPGPARIAGCMLLVLIIWQALRIAGFAFSVMFRLLLPFTWWTAITVTGAGFILSLFATPISDFLQDMEQRYWSPVYVDQFSGLSDGELLALYEMELRRHTTPEEFAIVRDSTVAIADRIGSTPIAIYEAAYLECGLNPFRVRDDKVAAGWIQFTRAGLSGLGVSMGRVIRACEKREAAFIMGLSGKYLEHKAKRLPQGATLRNTIDLYLAIFAPAHIGRKSGQVVYAGLSDRRYTLNSGLDGWYIDGGKIIRSRVACDGRITVGEIYLCLESKKARLIKQRE